ncbi:MAG: hypothetical protein IJZ29_04865 [Clostridia bacterium]|nr:hypothetical protein [Clostridia bacterium]
MSVFVDNKETMARAGKEYFEDIEKKQEQHYKDLTDTNNVDKILEKNKVEVSKEAKAEYKRLTEESEGAGFARKAENLYGTFQDYMNARKIAKIDTLEADASLNKNYQMPLNEKELKGLKKSMESAQKATAIFDKVHEKFKKYGLWCLLLCVLVPFAIPAMIGVLAIVGGEFLLHEAMCQHEYNKVIKPLTNKGKNKYKNMHYSKGYKEIEKLTATPISNEDLMKALVEANKNEKDPKVKENLNKALAKVGAEMAEKQKQEKESKQVEVQQEEPQLEGEEEKRPEVEEEIFEEEEKNKGGNLNEGEEEKEELKEENGDAEAEEEKQKDGEVEDTPEEVEEKEEPELVNEEEQIEENKKKKEEDRGQ